MWKKILHDCIFKTAKTKLLPKVIFFMIYFALMLNRTSLWIPLLYSIEYYDGHVNVQIFMNIVWKRKCVYLFFLQTKCIFVLVFDFLKKVFSLRIEWWNLVLLTVEQETPWWSHAEGGLVRSPYIPRDWNDQRETEKGLKIHVPDDRIPPHSLWRNRIHSGLFWEGMWTLSQHFFHFCSIWTLSQYVFNFCLIWTLSKHFFYEAFFVWINILDIHRFTWLVSFPFPLNRMEMNLLFTKQ